MDDLILRIKYFHRVTRKVKAKPDSTDRALNKALKGVKFSAIEISREFFQSRFAQEDWRVFCSNLEKNGLTIPENLVFNPPDDVFNFSGNTLIISKVKVVDFKKDKRNK